MSSDRFERRRKIEREHEGLDHRAVPETSVRPSVMRRAKQSASQKLRRALHAILNVIPQRVEEENSGWLTTTTDEVLAVTSHVRGSANIELRRDRAQPSWESLRDKVVARRAEDASDLIQPPDVDENA